MRISPFAMTIRQPRDFLTAIMVGLLALVLVTNVLGSTCTVFPTTPAAGQKVTVTYTKIGGALANATSIYLHRGINGYTVIAADTLMTYNSSTKKYTCIFWLPEVASSLNVCFSNGSGTYDNNNTANWNYTVSPATPPATVTASPLPAAASQANVMMQGFYWNVPDGGTWYTTMAAQAAALRNMEGGQGIDRIWFPPPSKSASGGDSMGYDPYDYYDLGAYNQLGTTATRFGTQPQLRNAVAAFHAQGIACMADMVLNHRSGGASENNANLSNASTYTNFGAVASGQCTWHYNQFHPSTYETNDDGVFGGFPDLCHAAGTAAGAPYYDLMAWGSWLTDPANAGFDGGWRFDYVRGYRPSYVAAFRAGTGNAFGVLEDWDTNIATLDLYVNYTGGTTTFDFPAYYTLQSVCNDTTGTVSIADLVDPNLVYAAHNPAKAVTFCANHDTDLITSNKMLAYAFILTYQGYPCIFWHDYFNNGLATLGGQSGNGINRLVWVRGALGGGQPSIQVLQSNDDEVLVYGTLNGTGSHPGYLVAINKSASAKTATIATANWTLKGKTLGCYAWYSYVDGQNVQPTDATSGADGTVTVQVPPSGYAVYGPKNLVTVMPPWTGVAPAQVHATAVNNGEWIYTGAANDYRAFTGATADSDLTQVRVTSDDTYVYFRITMQSITDVTIPAVGIALDTNQSTTTGRGYGWIGEASTPTGSLGLGNVVQNAETELMFYVGADGQPAIDVWDGGTWHAPASADSALAISTSSNTLEARINKNDLGIVYPQRVTLTLASFRSSGRAPGNNSTFDCPDKNNDAIDVMGGDVGVSANAWTRGGLSNNLVSRYSQFVLDADGARAVWIGNQSHSPADGSLDAADDLWLNVETWPQGAASGVSAQFEVNGGTWMSQALAANGQIDVYDAWHLDLGKQPVGALIKYAFNATDATRDTVSDNNGGADYTAQVNTAAQDSDGDGIPDWWMLAHFGHGTAQAADHSRATDDADGDGMSNLQEYLAGTDPLGAPSVLRVTAITRNASGNHMVMWSSVAGKSYQVLAATTPGGPFVALSGAIASQGASTSFTDADTGNVASKFYEVVVLP